MQTFVASVNFLPMILYTKMKRSVRRIKPVFHTHIDLSTAEIPRKTNIMVSDPLAKTFMTYLTVVTDFSSMFALMYFWQHIPQKTILDLKKKKKVCQIHASFHTFNEMDTNNITNKLLFSFFHKYWREDGRQGEHLSGQVGKVSQHKDKAWFNDLDVSRAPRQKGNQETEHKAQEGTTKCYHKEGNCNERKKTKG